jgi:DNA-binding NtrC family response regulator
MLVDIPESMREVLAMRKWDIVLSDFTMPKFSGLAALVMLKESYIDLPFIIVSGKIGADERQRSVCRDHPRESGNEGDLYQRLYGGCLCEK